MVGTGTGTGVGSQMFVPGTFIRASLSFPQRELSHGLEMRGVQAECPDEHPDKEREKQQDRDDAVHLDPPDVTEHIANHGVGILEVANVGVPPQPPRPWP